MDSAYDADDIHAHSRRRNHEPIIAPPPGPELCRARQERFKARTMSERVSARLNDEFGVSWIRVRGAAKVMAHRMFPVFALAVDQWLRLGLLP